MRGLFPRPEENGWAFVRREKGSAGAVVAGRFVGRGRAEF